MTVLYKEVCYKGTALYSEKQQISSLCCLPLATSWQMDNVGYNAVIQYLGIKGLPTKDMAATLGEDAPPYSILVNKWAGLLILNRTDDPCHGRALTVTAKDTIVKFHKFPL